MMANTVRQTTDDIGSKRIALNYWLLQILLTSKVKTNDPATHQSMIRQTTGRKKKPANLSKLIQQVFPTAEMCSPADGRNLVAFPILDDRSAGLHWKLEARFFSIGELIEEALKCA